MYLNSPKYPNFFVNQIFNFNKSCIWILIDVYSSDLIDDLTLTRVVFESIQPFNAPKEGTI